MSYRGLGRLPFSEDADAVVTQLNSIQRSTGSKRRTRFSAFGGGIESVPVAHNEIRRKSALRHTLDAGNAATSAVKLAAQNISRCLQENHRHQEESNLQG
jgi:hypothetical protein